MELGFFQYAPNHIEFSIFPYKDKVKVKTHDLKFYYIHKSLYT